MRKAFVDTLCQLAAENERIVLLTGDLGFMVFEPFRERFPDRFYNVGVAEQNMIGMATGLAEAGFIPFAYSIATFASLRAFEFIRNGPVLHNLPVRIVGMGMGFEYGHAGPTHHATEDIAVMRTLPGLSIVIPADSAQTATAFRQTWNCAGPVYYSLGKDDRASIPQIKGQFALGRAQVVGTEGNLAIIAMGSIAAEACSAAEDLASDGILAKVVIVSNFYPDPEEDIVKELANCSHAVTVEAQSISGGLAAFVGAKIASNNLSCQLHPLAVRTPPDGTSGSQRDRWRKHGLDRESIVRTCRTALENSRR